MKEIFEKHNLKFEKDFYEKVCIYSKLLLEYNKTHNITALRDEKSIYENILDSVFVLKFIQFENSNVCDVGSGAGFPALPLACALKQCRFDLYEPIAKKSAFLHLVKAKINLENVHIKTERIEKVTNKNYDFITSRAVSDTRVLLNLCKNVSSPKTKYLFYKGSRVYDEVDGVDGAKIFKGNNDRHYLLLKEQK